MGGLYESYANIIMKMLTGESEGGKLALNRLC
ncbi:hypothetical protein PBAL39_07445 [Pedobacter sp. BAL39]|nr:hypothetical protein PBAL39_07445 [Pedobacter sp. BAL39]